MISRVAPITLVTRQRLDLVVKWRFFRHLMRDADRDAERVYRWHIAVRTGGREPRSWKGSVDDYVRGARDLLRSMSAVGFDPAHPVRVGSDDRLRGGAHRTACALALGLQIELQRMPAPSRAAPWGREWFEERGLPAADLERIELDWRRVHDESRHLLHE